jgi:hypothetical protein
MMGGLIEVGFVHFLDILKTRPTLWADTGNPGLYGKERTNIFFVKVLEPLYPCKNVQ